MDPRIGTELAGHRIERVIGRGGASIVYLAEHVRLGRNVALKVLAPHLAEDETFRERFIRESRIAAAMDHPNIVTIYDAGEVEAGLYISMRYVEGSDLGKLLHAEGALEPSRTLLLLSQVAAALDAAHAKGLVHRDVKPGNVLLETTDTALERAYLSDFGISKRTTTGSGLTRTGQFVGTVDYVAPEQITGEQIDGRTDVYSLGCVLFQCLVGHVPFPSETEVATIYSHLNDAPPSFEGSVTAPYGLTEVLAQALAKSKEDRYPTCSALIEAARGALSGARETPTVVRSVVKPGAGPSRAEPDTQVIGEALPGRGPLGRRVLRFAAAGTAVVAAVVAVVLLTRADGTGRPGPTDTGTSTGATGPSPPPASERLFLTWNLLKERSGPGDEAMFDVVSTADGLVAVGHVQDPGADDDAAVWLSPDTDRWRPSGSEVLGGTGDQRLMAVTEFRDRLVTGGWNGDGAGIWYSGDGGSSWTASASPALHRGDQQQIRDLVMLGDRLVAVGGIGVRGDQDAAVWISADGVNWTLVEDEDLVASGDQQIWSVHKVGGRLMGVGYTFDPAGTYDGALWTSEDGREWSRVDPAMFSDEGHQLMKAAGGGSEGLPFVIVGCEDDLYRCDVNDQDSDAAVWTSPDGETWTKVDLRGGGLVGDGLQTMYDLSRHGGTLVAAGTATGPNGDRDAAVWTSTDGRSWSLRRQPPYAVAELDGAGDQTIRALTTFHRLGLTFVAAGVTVDGIAEHAVVWGGS